MAIVQSYRGNAKKINLRVKRTMPIDEEELKKKTKRKGDTTVRKIKLSSGKKPRILNLKVKHNEAN